MTLNKYSTARGSPISPKARTVSSRTAQSRSLNNTESSGSTASTSERPLPAQEMTTAYPRSWAACSTSATMRPKKGMVKSSTATPMAWSWPRHSDRAWWLTE